MKMTVLRDVTPSSSVARDQGFSAIYCPPPSGFTLKNDAASFFETMETSYKTTQYTPPWKPIILLELHSFALFQT
jgi:hypothetical protein